MGKFKKFIKDWMLPLAMLCGVLLYLVYFELDFLHPAGPVLLQTMNIIQPLLLFLMLFLTFCKIEPRQLRAHRWHWWILLVQVGSFAALAAVLLFLPVGKYELVIEAAMICMICPTATAAAVVTEKLGGDIAGVITYTMLINIAAAVAIPLVVPLLHPAEGKSFLEAFSLILAKVFPLLICPCLLAWMVRYMAPRLHRKIVRVKDLAFYIWAVSLTLAMLMTTRSFMHSGTSILLLGGMGVATLLCCALQFWAGKAIGGKYGQATTAGQALGQKNTVFAIWMGYTFMSPATAVAGGFYSIWHNCFNSWQLYKKRKSGS